MTPQSGSAGVARGRVWTVPNLLSLARVPLGAVFPFVIGRPHVALCVLVVSAFTDMLDGWWARTRGQVTVLGAVLDPITDKLFVSAVVVTLVITGKLGWLGVVSLATREIGEAPLVVWFLVSSRARERRVKNASANIPGKAATALQFVCVTLAILHSPWLASVLWFAAAAGVFAAITYWVRALKT